MTFPTAFARLEGREPRRGSSNGAKITPVQDGPGSHKPRNAGLRRGGRVSSRTRRETREGPVPTVEALLRARVLPIPRTRNLRTRFRGRPIDELGETEIRTKDGKRFAIRSELKGACGSALQAIGVAIPPTLRVLERSGEMPP